MRQTSMDRLQIRTNRVFNKVTEQEGHPTESPRNRQLCLGCGDLRPYGDKWERGW